MSRNTARPLSPHLTVWKWGPHMVTSILHRATGIALSVAGLALLTWWLLALAGSAAAYQSFTNWVAADLGQLEWGSFGAILASLTKLFLWLALIGLSWSFFQHTLSGVRHLIMDVGAGLEINVNKKMAYATWAGAALLTVALWTYILLGRGA